MQINHPARASDSLTTARRSRHPRTRRVGPLLGAAIAVAVIVGCGSGSPSKRITRTNSATDRVALVHSSTTATRSGAQASTKPGALTFSVCMRAHGVPDFPDPRPIMPSDLPGGVTQRAPGGGFTANPNSPAYLTASADCRPLAMATPVTQAAASQMMASQLKFAMCMRANGVPDYPDPTSTGEIGDNGAIGGVNPNSPAFQNAEKKCGSLRRAPPGLPGA
jgi:hypothetical protein